MSPVTPDRFMPLMLLLVVGLVVFIGTGSIWISTSRDEDVDTGRTLLNVGMLMIGAWVIGSLFHQYHLPKISGYLLYGIAVGPDALGLIHKEGIGSLQFVNDLAVAMIALTAGGEIRLEWLKGKFTKLISIIGIDILFILVLGGGAVFLLSGWIPFLDGAAPETLFFVCVITATVMIANSPTVVIAMISDYRAAGPLTQMTLAFTVCKDLVLIVLFATVTSVAKGFLDENQAVTSGFLIGVALQLIGSIGLGVLLGMVMAIYLHRVHIRMPFFVLGSCMFFALIGEQHFVVGGHDFHLEPLLIALTAGVLLQNMWPNESRNLFHTIESLSLPVYCLFFAIAGAKVDLGAFSGAWHIAVALVGVRTFAVWAGISTGLRLTGMREPWTGKLWFGMIPQAGVTLVLIVLVEQGFGPFGWGTELAALLIGMLVIHELLGPFGFRYALFSTCEAGQADQGRMTQKSV